VQARLHPTADHERDLCALMAEMGLGRPTSWGTVGADVALHLFDSPSDAGTPVLIEPAIGAVIFQARDAGLGSAGNNARTRSENRGGGRCRPEKGHGHREISCGTR